MPYPPTRAFNSNSNARRKLDVYCASRGQLAGSEHATGENKRGFFRAARLINATPIFRSGSINHLARPLRWPLSGRRDFSPRAKLAMHLATNEYATFPPRCTTTALRIIEPHPRCASCARKRGDVRGTYVRLAWSLARLNNDFIKLSATTMAARGRRSSSVEFITSVLCTPGIRDASRNHRNPCSCILLSFFPSFFLLACLL